MAGEMKHTPTPWIAVPQGDGSAMVCREYETGEQLRPKGLRIVAHVMARRDSLREDEANAIFIVEAVNSVSTLQSENTSLRDRVEVLEKENARLREALGKIAKAEIVVFDDDLQTNVVVSADEDEMANWAREALDLFPAGDEQGFSDAVALIEEAYPDHNWHIAKGRLSADEPLYGALIMEGEIEIAGGESDISAAGAMKAAILNARAALTGGADNG